MKEGASYSGFTIFTNGPIVKVELALPTMTVTIPLTSIGARDIGSSLIEASNVAKESEGGTPAPH